MKRRKGERGSSMIFVLLSILALLGIGAVAIDVGEMLVARTQLQNIADSTALAAAGSMIEFDGVAAASVDRAGATTMAQNSNVHSSS